MFKLYMFLMVFIGFIVAIASVGIVREIWDIKEAVRYIRNQMQFNDKGRC